MESNNRKLTVLTFFVLSAILSYVFFRALTQILDWAKMTNAVTAMFGHQPWKVVGGTISGAIGFIIFIVACVNKRSSSFFDEVYGEGRKVTWPTGQDTYRATM